MSTDHRSNGGSASEPSRSSKGDLADLEAKFWHLWSQFPTAQPCELDTLHTSLAIVFNSISSAPIRSRAGAAMKMRVALRRGGWTPDCFTNHVEGDPEKVAAEILCQVLEYLQGLGEAP